MHASNSSSSILASTSSTPIGFAHNSATRMYAQSSATAKPYFANNRRESLFYHSTDNHRMTYAQRQQQYLHEQQQQTLLREQQIKFIEQQEKLQQQQQQQQQQHQSRILSNKPKQQLPAKEATILRSTPVNVASHQLHSVCDMFREPAASFDRLHINQLSTKSQPPMPSDMLLLNGYHHGNGLNANPNLVGGVESGISSSTSSTASSSSSTTSTSACLSSMSIQQQQHQQLHQQQQQQQYYAEYNHAISRPKPQPMSFSQLNFQQKLLQQQQQRPPQANSYQKQLILPQPAQV